MFTPKCFSTKKYESEQKFVCVLYAGKSFVHQKYILVKMSNISYTYNNQINANEKHLLFQ